MVAVYSLDVLLFQFWTSPLLHVRFELLLLDLHTDFSGSQSDGIPISLRIFQFVVIQTVKGFNVANEAEVDVFLEFSCFFYDPADVGIWICGSSAFSKSSLNIWKFTVQVLLKPGLENFEHSFASVWDECNYVIVWAFFGIAFLWDWNENWPFPVPWPLLSFPYLLAYWVHQFHSIIFQHLKELHLNFITSTSFVHSDAL